MTSDQSAAERLRTFLFRLAGDHDLLWRYMKDPREAVSGEEHGLAEDHIEIIVEGDLDAIRELLREAGYDDDIIRGTGIIVRPVK